MKLKTGAAIVVALLFGLMATGTAQTATHGKKQEVPLFGTFYSLTLRQPPFPFNPFPELPVSEVKPGVFVYDDRTVDYLAVRQEQAALKEASKSMLLEEGGGGGGMMMLMGGSGNTNLALSIPIIQGTNVVMTLVNAITNQPYDLFSTATIGTTNPWTYLGRLPAGTTNISVPKAGTSGGGAQATAFNSADTTDSDGDSLSDAIENLVTQTNEDIPDNTNSVPPGSIGQDLLTDKPIDLYVKSYRRDYITHSLAGGDVQGWGGTQSWVRAMEGTGAQFEIFTEPPIQTNWANIVTWDGAGNPTPASAEQMPPLQKGYRRWHEIVISPPGDPNPFTTHLIDDVTTKMELFTGGRALSTNTYLFVFHLTADDGVEQPDGSFDPVPIPAADITVLGEHPDASGRIWKMLPDSRQFDVTPVATSAHTNYSFELSAQKLKLKITRNSIEVTDSLQTVWVGEPISLICELVPSEMTISNFNWTVPGLTLSNYVANIDTGKVHHVFPQTNFSVNFYWGDGMELATVQCTTVINGFQLGGRVHFQVKRPNASINAQLLSNVTVDNNYDNSPALHFGYYQTVSGIKFSYSTDGVGSYQWVQLGTTIRRIKSADDGLWYRAVGTGLDGKYPYEKAKINNIEQEWTADDPGMSPLVTHLEYTAQDSFQMYLMFKPIVAGNPIWIPLRKTEWNWAGHATLVNGAYVLSSGSRSISWADINTTAHPEWTTNIDTGLNDFILE